MASILLAIVAKGDDEWRDLQPVDVIPATLSLRFKNVPLSLICISGNADCVFTFCCVVQGVDGCKCGAYSVDVCSGRSA